MEPTRPMRHAIVMPTRGKGVWGGENVGSREGKMVKNEFFKV